MIDYIEILQLKQFSIYVDFDKAKSTTSKFIKLQSTWMHGWSSFDFILFTVAIFIYFIYECLPMIVSSIDNELSTMRVLHSFKRHLQYGFSSDLIIFTTEGLTGVSNSGPTNKALKYYIFNSMEH